MGTDIALNQEPHQTHDRHPPIQHLGLFPRKVHALIVVFWDVHDENLLDWLFKL